MAKFWRHIRQVVQNVPIPGIGITIQDAKDIYGGIKTDPGGTLVYEPPPAGTTSETGEQPDLLAGGVQVRQYNLWLWVAIIAGVLLYTK